VKLLGDKQAYRKTDRRRVKHNLLSDGINVMCCFVVLWRDRTVEVHWRMLPNEDKQRYVACCWQMALTLMMRTWWWGESRGGATVLKVGGTNSASGASRKFFLTPTFWPVGGQNIAYIAKSVIVLMLHCVRLVRWNLRVLGLCVVP